MAFEPITDRALTGAFLGKELRCELLRLAAAAVPEEACGLLFSSMADAERGFEGRALSAVQVPNVAPSEEAHQRFDLDPAAWAAAERDARARGEALLAIWHSHPDGPPRPSREDAAGAAALPSGMPYVLVDLSAAGSPSAVTFWSWCPATRPSAPRGDRPAP